MLGMAAGGSFVGLDLRERTPELARDRSLFAVHFDDETVSAGKPQKSGCVPVQLFCQKQMRHPGSPSNKSSCAGSPIKRPRVATHGPPSNGGTHSRHVS